MRDVATVVEENGKLGVRATFKKRYITLAPVAGCVGLAVNLKVGKQTLPSCQADLNGSVLQREVPSSSSLQSSLLIRP